MKEVLDIESFVCGLSLISWNAVHLKQGIYFDIKLSLIERSLKYWNFCVWLKPYWYAIHLKQVIYFYIKLYHKKKSHLLKGSIFAGFGMWYTKSNVRILGFWILIRNKRKNLLSKQKNIYQIVPGKQTLTDLKLPYQFFYCTPVSINRQPTGFELQHRIKKSLSYLFFFSINIMMSW